MANNPPPAGTYIGNVNTTPKEAAARIAAGSKHFTDALAGLVGYGDQGTPSRANGGYGVEPAGVPHDENDMPISTQGKNPNGTYTNPDGTTEPQWLKDLNDAIENIPLLGDFASAPERVADGRVAAGWGRLTSGATKFFGAPINRVLYFAFGAAFLILGIWFLRNNATQTIVVSAAKKAGQIVQG